MRFRRIGIIFCLQTIRCLAEDRRGGKEEQRIFGLGNTVDNALDGDD